MGNSYLDVKRIKAIVRQTNPYRGSDNRYPLLERKYGHKHFLVDKDSNGETIYRIMYGYVSSWEELTQQQYDAYKALPNLPTNSRLTDHSYDCSDGSGRVERYHLVTTIPNEMGIVREDNTFEYTSKAYHQGDNNFMSQVLRVEQRASKAHGGLILITHNKGWQLNKDNVKGMHPVFKGLRIHLDTLLPHHSCDYKITSNKVSRKDGKEFLKKYQDFYMVCETMMSVMLPESFIELAVELITNKAHLAFDSYYIPQPDINKLIDLAHENMNDSPIDSLVMFGVAYDVDRIWQRLRKHTNKGHYYYTELDLNSFFQSAKRKINKGIYKDNPSVLKQVEHKQGEYYPSSEWGIYITVNDLPVEQYN